LASKHTQLLVLILGQRLLGLHPFLSFALAVVVVIQMGTILMARLVAGWHTQTITQLLPGLLTRLLWALVALKARAALLLLTALGFCMPAVAKPP
jgi:hypothetical protein